MFLKARNYLLFRIMRSKAPEITHVRTWALRRASYWEEFDGADNFLLFDFLIIIGHRGHCMIPC
jgi:hypothetical protein